jgi:hypothetical protein
VMRRTADEGNTGLQRCIGLDHAVGDVRAVRAKSLFKSLQCVMNRTGYRMDFGRPTPDHEQRAAPLFFLNC